MSKVWYCMRLLQPTQAFFSTIQSVMYKFIWQNKRPLLAFDQLCMALREGGLGVLHPKMQHLVLQTRHLRHVFDDSHADNYFISSLLQYHFSLITPSECCPTLPFFASAFRKQELNTPLPIVHSIYKAFDHFQLSPDLSTISLSVLLILPLTYMLTDVPDDHWLQKQPLLPASCFFLLIPLHVAYNYEELGNFRYGRDSVDV
ncbi:MAG: hypothetical protein EXX96DRAFT_589557 [Benjaminiella poitrasii]|nr:MAG: hypothetical protein EXX96DRAFT_589557 [Benjaminiella poitrasii]